MRGHDTMEMDINQVLAAIDTLYSNDGSRNKEDITKANLFLGNLQKTVS